MTLHPILAALHKHKAGVFLIGLQIALTLAIVCNILFYVAQQVQHIQRPTGLDEANLFLIEQTYVDAPEGTDPAAIEKRDALQLTDLATLRGLPDAEDATPVNSLPLLRSGQTDEMSLKPGVPHGATRAHVFTGDEHLFKTLGLRLIAGRPFTSADVLHGPTAGKPAVVIVSKALADMLFPHGDALGKPIYIAGGSEPRVIVGVIARLLTPFSDGTIGVWNSVLLPDREDDATTYYAVRARPGRMQDAIREARKALFKANPMRVIEQQGRYDPAGIHTYAQIRTMGYALDLFMVHVLTVICVILLGVTGIGMTGLTSFWVRQRHEQIGVRRALGARRIDILRYFQAENLVIAGGGCVVGAVLAIAINLALMRAFAMDRMPLW